MVSLCVYSHDKDGLNYPWLDDVHGGLNFILYEEPISAPGSKPNWQMYTEKVWEAHCKVVSHNPQDLVQAHINAFINPSKRFTRLMFVFNDGTAMEPIPYFYELEAQWFANRVQNTMSVYIGPKDTNCGQGGKCACGPNCRCGPECSC